jgi:predicted metal-dependent hydrolase
LFNAFLSRFNRRIMIITHKILGRKQSISMNFDYKINRSRKREKTISLQINDKSELVISVPYFTPMNDINNFIREKQNWINKTILKQKGINRQNKAREYIDGEIFYYLGKSHPLKVFFEPFENAGIVFWDDCFYLNTKGNKDVRKHYFVSWYKKKAQEYIHQRVDFFGRMLKFQYENIRITSAQSRWGSCSGDNHLAFSFRLIMAPPEIIDYVIVHELMHIKEKNHSPQFWKRVESVIPEYKKLKRWLKDNHYKFVL